MDTEEALREELHRLTRTIEEKAKAMGLGRARVNALLSSGELVPVRIRRGENALMDALVNFILKTQTGEGGDWSQRDIKVTVLRRGEGR
jgi:hypothetical protein